MQSIDINTRIPYSSDITKKWTFLQYAYSLWQNQEFVSEPLKVKEELHDVTHTIYTGITKEEFVLYLYFTDIKEVKLVGKNADCILSFATGDVVLSYYERPLHMVMDAIIQKMNSFVPDEEPNFDFKMYFFLPERNSEFYYQFISFVYNLEETNVKSNGIKICDKKGHFKQYFDLEFPRDNLDKFLYYDGNIFIGSHSQNDMIVVFNLPRSKVLELRQWCMTYEN